MCRYFLQLHKQEAKLSRDAGAATWSVTSSTAGVYDLSASFCRLWPQVLMPPPSWLVRSAAVFRRSHSGSSGRCWIWRLCALADDSCMQPYSHLFIYLFFFSFYTIASCTVSSRISPIRCNKVVSMATEKRVTDSQWCHPSSCQALRTLSHLIILNIEAFLSQAEVRG